MQLDAAMLVAALIPSWSSVLLLASYLVYLAVAGKSSQVRLSLEPSSPTGLASTTAAMVSSFFFSSCIHYYLFMSRCHKQYYEDLEKMLRVAKIPTGLVSLFLLLVLTATGVYMGWISPTAIADKGVELLSATFIFSLFVSFVLHAGGSRSRNQSSSLKPYVTGNFIHDWWFGVQLNPHFMGVDLKFFFVRAGMTAWLFINLSLLAKSYLAGTANLSVFLYQLFCALYIIDYFVHEEFMTST
uniref:Delta(14)-sterol reductase n=1 Tax=Ananas comosus var. bracteatus TaxID=296719 RepID=A0A6V7Q6S1_ANACO|nr:unnamed protein product [Ananas comosus var. bracteatus]